VQPLTAFAWDEHRTTVVQAHGATASNVKEAVFVLLDGEFQPNVESFVLWVRPLHPLRPLLTSHWCRCVPSIVFSLPGVVCVCCIHFVIFSLPVVVGVSRVSSSHFPLLCVSAASVSSSSHFLSFCIRPLHHLLTSCESSSIFPLLWVNPLRALLTHRARPTQPCPVLWASSPQLPVVIATMCICESRCVFLCVVDKLGGGRAGPHTLTRARSRLPRSRPHACCTLSQARKVHSVEAPEADYAAAGQDAIAAYMSNPDRTFCFFDVAVGDKPAGRIVCELYKSTCPKTCENFARLCVGGDGTTADGVNLTYKVRRGGPDKVHLLIRSLAGTLALSHRARAHTHTRARARVRAHRSM
jgi:hypothetical protein